jgi:fatty-acyl-CoA synthase
MSSFITPSRETTLARLMRGYSRVAALRRDSPYTVADRLEERAAANPDRPFILFEDQCISYGEANRRANRVAHAALAAGLAPGEAVALLMLNRPEYLLMWLGLAKAGIGTALINTSATGEVLAHALRQVDARALIVGAELALAVETLPRSDRPSLLFESTEPGTSRSGVTGCIDFDTALLAASDANPERSLRAGITMADPLYYMFTSGTTGLPKAVRMSHMRFINAGEVMAGFMEFGPKDVFYCCLPLFHGAGGMVVPSVALAAACPFVLRRKFSRSGFWQDVRHYNITGVYYIGEVIRFLLATASDAADRDHSLRIMCGAGLKADVWQAFVDRFGVSQVFEGLGATEANYGITNVDGKIGSVGRLPYPQHTNIRVVRYDVERESYVHDEAGRLIEAKPGEIGELIAAVLDGPGAAGLFEGYTSAEATETKLLRNVFASGDVWFRSGDLVRFDADDYFYFVDRVGDTFRWKSENVSTQEVELVLGGFAGPATINVYGVAVPGAEGCAGMAALTYENPGDFDPVAFYGFAVGRLAPYAVPLFVRLTANAAMTASFKLRKVELKREGYDPILAGGDPLFVADFKAARYVLLTPEALVRTGLPPFLPASA